MVIDDEPDVILLCRVNLEHAGHEVVEAGSAEEGLDAALSERPDAIVLDVMLPNRDGFALLQDLGAKPETAETPVVMLSAKVQLSDQRRGWDAGASGYLTKPFLPSNLTETVDRVARMTLEERQILRERALAELNRRR